ncbi:MAG: polysaccharide deacetylase family protein [Chlamydiota bacterium]
MLITFLYHSIKNPFLFEKHLEYLVKKYVIVTPGDPLILTKTQICLSFDDGYKDFYTVVFPLLQKWNIPATLAVPIEWIGKASFCTWEDIIEMNKSGLVPIASHSYTHPNLLEKNVDYEKEIVISQKVLEDKLQKPISTFVYPYGKFNASIHSKVKQYYPFVMRIGTAININWQNRSGLIYRIPNDDFSQKEKSICYYYSLLWNTLRNR